MDMDKSECESESEGSLFLSFVANKHTSIRAHNGPAAAEQTAIDHSQRRCVPVIQYDKTHVLVVKSWVEKLSRVVY